MRLLGLVFFFSVAINYADVKKNRITEEKRNLSHYPVVAFVDAHAPEDQSHCLHVVSVYQEQHDIRKKKKKKDEHAVAPTAGHPNHSLISATLTPPLRLASRSTSASLNRPEQPTSDTTVPTSRPRKSRPCVRGVQSAYAAGIIVITDRTHQYHVKA